jgi:hypothetical protein
MGSEVLQGECPILIDVLDLLERNRLSAAPRRELGELPKLNDEAHAR